MGLELERRGDLRAAMEMYKEAAESNNRFAQRKLGDIYGTGNAAVERDYQTSLKWYRRAQTDGLDIPNRPFTFPGVRR
jgi:TPR repeat protein